MRGLAGNGPFAGDKQKHLNPLAEFYSLNQAGYAIGTEET